jgi:hypothetical protein
MRTSNSLPIAEQQESPKLCYSLTAPAQIGQINTAVESVDCEPGPSTQSVEERETPQETTEDQKEATTEEQKESTVDSEEKVANSEGAAGAKAEDLDFESWV